MHHLPLRSLFTIYIAVALSALVLGPIWFFWDAATTAAQARPQSVEQPSDRGLLSLSNDGGLLSLPNDGQATEVDPGSSHAWDFRGTTTQLLPFKVDDERFLMQQPARGTELFFIAPAEDLVRLHPRVCWQTEGRRACVPMEALLTFLTQEGR